VVQAVFPTDDPDAFTLGGGTSPPTCGVTIASSAPEPGDTGVFYESDVVVTLGAVDPTSTLSLASGDLPVSGHTDYSRAPGWWADETVLTFTPDAPFAPSTDYVATVHTCEGDTTLPFHTSDHGLPVTDPAALAGRAYLYDLATAELTLPVIGAASPRLLAITTAGDELGLLDAVADPEGAEDTCEKTTLFHADFSASPYFETAPASVTLSFGGTLVPLTDAVFAGTVAPDGASIAGLSLSGVFDTRPLAPLLDDSGDEAAGCYLAANFGGTCVPCASDGEPYCLAVRADGMTALAADGAVVPVKGYTCDGCEDGPPGKEAVCAEAPTPAECATGGGSAAGGLALAMATVLAARRGAGATPRPPSR
jgi:hypothetical protein